MKDAIDAGGSECRFRIYVDGDACPVKDEVYRVADRYGLTVYVVANSYLRVPRGGGIEMVLVPDGPDAADDWIAERCDGHAIVITADIPLADRALKAEATAISPTGKPFTADAIGMAMATRALMQDLRSATPGENFGGPKAFTSADRSRFLQALDTAVQRLMQRSTL